MIQVSQTSVNDQHIRSAHVFRETRETRVDLTLNLDGSGASAVHSGVGFLDHMLDQVALHGLFDLTLDAQGDLDVDMHHTVEDVALALGDAFSQALGERKGIVRCASASVPMDDSLGEVVVDLSGRSYCVFQAEWHGSSVGALPVSLVEHFFASFASQARCNLHARVVYGKDDHHQAEALFKALGRALDMAVQINPRRDGQVPSTKGSL
jgi:imidazoleglycerol-phosphate dehydratase